MLDIIQKNEYFNWLSENIADRKNHSLKGIQDGWALSLLSETQDLTIAEVGGGNSRVLRKLSEQNECWNIDKFEGVGQGPTEMMALAGVKVVRSYLGDFDTAIPNRYFDVVFSVSVVEHVPTEKLDNFFADCHRILKPGGMMAHAIDLYIFDAVNDRLQIIDRYRTAIEKQGFTWYAAPVIDKSATFQCNYASNSDITMHDWNQVVPSLQTIRETAQSVSIKLIVFKKTDADTTVNSTVSLAKSKQSERALRGNFSATQRELPPKQLNTPAKTRPASNSSLGAAHVNSVQANPTQTNPAVPSPKVAKQKLAKQKPSEPLPVVAILTEEEPVQLATALAGRIGRYYSRWPALLAGIAIALNTIALFDEMPGRWVFSTGGTIVLLFLVGHAASKADYVLAEVEQLKKLIARKKP